MTCISTTPHDHLATLLAPNEPICFTTCDGPHSGVPDDKRPPHADDVAFGYLRLPPDSLRQPPESLLNHVSKAEQWSGYGFTAADVGAWQAAGIYEPAVAAECRTVGFDPHCWVDRRFLLSDDPETGRPFCDLLCDSDITAAQAWERWKAWP